MAFFTLLILTRILGKKQVSQLTFFEYVLGITIGSTAANMSTNLSTRPFLEFVGLLTWTFFVLILEVLALKNRKLAKLADGEPTILIENGKIMEDKLAATFYRFDDLMKDLRKKNVFNISDVEFAILETDGSLSVLTKSQAQPVTPRDLQIPTAYKGLDIELIQDGQIIQQNLEQINLDQNWLLAELDKRGLALDKIAYGSIDTKGVLYLDLYDDQGIDIVDPSDYEGPN